MSRVPRFLALFLVIVTLASAGAGSAAPGPGLQPQVAPAIFDCSFFPDPRVNVSYLCGDDNSLQPGYIGAPVRFNLSALDPEGDNLTFTFYFDYFLPGPIVNPDSPVVNVNVTPPAPGELAYVETTWTYQALSNFSAGLNSSRYWVYVEVRNSTGEFDPSLGTWLFPVIVNTNAEPFVDGLVSIYAVSPGISYQTRIVPLLYLNVSVADPDGDALTVTWDWGDGTLTVNQTPPTLDRTDLNLTHQYSVNLFPLNETPRKVRTLITVHLDDGVPGHNLTQMSAAEFDLDFDLPPRVKIDSPEVGSRWKINEPVPMVSNITDLEGDPVTMYWDFDDRVDGDSDGNPSNDRDDLRSVTSHAYSAVGDYNVTLWATDGVDKKLCFDENCTASVSHWTKAVIPFRVSMNVAPVLALSRFVGYKAVPVLLRAEIYDADGDDLNVTWNFGDGTADATNLTTGNREIPQLVRVYQEHNYTRAGNFTLTVRVSDGTDVVEDTKNVTIESFNEPPDQPQIEVFSANWTKSGSFSTNETVIINVTVHDAEGDPMEITVDWGDGNVSARVVEGPSATNCTSTADNKTICSFSHVYLLPEEGVTKQYMINVTVTDNEEWFQRNITANGTEGKPIERSHTKRVGATIFVTSPRAPEVWDWWDYSTLAALIGFLGFLVGRGAWRVRMERMEE